MAKKNEPQDQKDTKTSPKAHSAEGKPRAKKGEEHPEAHAEAKTAKAPKAKKPASGPKRAPLVERTIFMKPGQVPAKWRLIDATGIPLGRLSTQIATILMGKDKACHTRSIDTGDSVIVINAKNVKLTGNKWQTKEYKYHTNYPGGLKTFTALEILNTHPERLIEWSVWGMLPKYKGHMVNKWYKKLRVFAGAEHNHQAQTPELVKLPDLGNWE